MTNENRTDMQAALREFKEAHGQPAVRALLESVAGVTAASEVPDNKVAAVIAATKRKPDAAHASKGRVPSSFEELATRAYDTWNKGWRRSDRSAS